jgi:hypothetical protein
MNCYPRCWVGEPLFSYFLQHTGTCTCLHRSRFDSLCQKISSLTASAICVLRIRFACSVPMKWIVRQTSGIQAYMPIRIYAFFSVQQSRVRDVGFLCASDPLCVGQTSGQWVVAKFCHATLQRGLALPLSSPRQVRWISGFHYSRSLAKVPT